MMGGKKKVLDRASITIDIPFSDYYPESTRLDVTLPTYVSRMNANSDILVKRGGFTYDEAREALLGKPKNSEKVAQWLRVQLSQLRKDEDMPSKAPVLAQNSLGRTAISDIAITILEASEEPRPQLTMLFVELLNVDRHRQTLSKKKDAERYNAVEIDAQLDGIGVRTLAKFLSVAQSTVSQWRRDPTYQRDVEILKRLMSNDANLQGLHREAKHLRRVKKDQD